MKAVIDLHGYKLDEAEKALNNFISKAYEKGKRCIKVITGKGLRSGNDEGTIKRNIKYWLNSDVNRGKIVTFTYAKKSDGGEGALYILIKRIKLV